MAYRRTKRTYGWIAAIPILLLIAALWSRGRYREDLRWVEHTREVQEAIYDLQSTLADAETGRRGFVITGDPSFLTPVDAAASRAPQIVERLRQLTRDNPIQQENVRVLDRLVHDRAEFLKHAAQIGHTQGFQPMERRSGLGVSVDLHDVANRMIAEEDRLLRARQQVSAASDRDVVLLYVAGIATTFLLLLWSYRIVQRYAAKLRESEESFRATFFQAAVGIAQTSTDGHWLLLNDRFCEIFGYSRDELLGNTFVDITHPDDREASLAAFRKLLAGEISSWSAEKRYIRKDGVTVWARLFVSLVRDRQNQPLYLIPVVEDITEKIHAERALQESRRELRALAGSLINAQEEERRRISRQLHDDFNQRLAMVAFDTSGLVQAPPTSDQMKKTLKSIHSRIVQMSEDIRRISHQLHPSILEDLGLAAALRELCEEFSAREGIEATLEQETMPESLPMEVKSCLYGIAQEALHNISKHAHATHVQLSLVRDPQVVHMGIHDDGAGFDLHAGRGHGLGIISMKERARMVQGELSLHSKPGWGAEVRVFVPLSKAS